MLYCESRMFSGSENRRRTPPVAPPPMTTTSKRMGSALGHAAVGVLEADDVVLAEVAARLHLDQVHGLVAGVLEAMRHADGNVGRLVLAQHGDLLAARDPGGAAHDDPVFGALVVVLQ